MPRAACGEIWENISTPACQIPAHCTLNTAHLTLHTAHCTLGVKSLQPTLQSAHRAGGPKSQFCKTQALNPVERENMTGNHVLKGLQRHFNNQSSPSRAICSNCSGRSVHKLQNFQNSRKLPKKCSTWETYRKYYYILNIIPLFVFLPHLLLKIVCAARCSVVVAILCQVFLWETEVDALQKDGKTQM